MVDVPPGSVRARLGELLSSGPHGAEAALTLIEAQSGARLGQAVVNLATMLDGAKAPRSRAARPRRRRHARRPPPRRLAISLAAVATLDAAAAEVAPPGADFASVRGEAPKSAPRAGGIAPPARRAASALPPSAGRRRAAAGQRA